MVLRTVSAASAAVVTGGRIYREQECGVFVCLRWGLGEVDKDADS